MVLIFSVSLRKVYRCSLRCWLQKLVLPAVFLSRWRKHVPFHKEYVLWVILRIICRILSHFMIWWKGTISLLAMVYYCFKLFRFFLQAHLHCRIHLSCGPRLCNRPMRCVTNRPRPTALTWISDQWSDQSSIKWVKQCHKPPIWEWFIIVLPTLANIFHWNDLFVFFHTPYWSIE